MALMVQPWKHPETGYYYIRRQIPKKLRPAFDGRPLHKVSLGTKDFAKACILFTTANAELEQQFEEARARFASTGDPRPSQRDHADALMRAYFEGPEFAQGGLDGPERLDLARRQIDRGLWNATPNGCTEICSAEEWTELAGNAALFRSHPIRRRHVQGYAPGAIWQWSDARFRDGARDAQIAQVIEQIARHHGLDPHEIPDAMTEVVRRYLDALPVGASQARKPKSAQPRQRPGMRLLELYDAWKAGREPTEKTAYEFRQSVVDFIDHVGDITIGEIEAPI